MKLKIQCKKCTVEFHAHWLKDGMCNGCRNPHLIVEDSSIETILTRAEFVMSKLGCPIERAIEIANQRMELQSNLNRSVRDLFKMKDHLNYARMQQLRKHMSVLYDLIEIACWEGLK